MFSDLDLWPHCKLINEIRYIKKGLNKHDSGDRLEINQFYKKSEEIQIAK